MAFASECRAVRALQVTPQAVRSAYGYDSKAPSSGPFRLHTFAAPIMFPAEKRQNATGELPQAPSKSERKRAMHELQALGEALIALDPGRLAALAISCSILRAESSAVLCS